MITQQIVRSQSVFTRVGGLPLFRLEIVSFAGAEEVRKPGYAKTGYFRREECKLTNELIDN